MNTFIGTPMRTVPKSRRDSAVSLANHIAEAAEERVRMCMTARDLPAAKSWQRMAMIVAGVGRRIVAGRVSPDVILRDSKSRNPMGSYADELLSRLSPDVLAELAAEGADAAVVE
jgi:hypothetical protein